MHRTDFTISSRSEYRMIRQKIDVIIRRIYFHRPSLFFIRRGRKVIATPSETFTAKVGEVIVISAGYYVDITNFPDETGHYEADAFVFGNDVLSAPTPNFADLKPIGFFAPPSAFQDCLASASAALAADGKLPADIVRHRVSELVVWARSHGLNPTARESLQLPARVRQWVANLPSHPWRISELAAKLAMSEPSLRRHLASEGTSATEIIADVRMTMALTQLQTTTDSITQISLAAGYQSPSQFARRFRARFSVSPSQIRGRGGHNDQIGIKGDRSGGEVQEK